MIEYDGATSSFNGNGVAVVFPFSPLKAFAAADVRLFLRSPAAVETEVLQGASATTFAVEVSTYPGTGQIRYPAVGGSPLPTGWSGVIKIAPALRQTVDLENQGGYNPDVLEQALDQVVVQQKSVQEDLDRALQVPITDGRTPEDYLDDLVDTITATAQAAANAAGVSQSAAAASASAASTSATNANNSAVAAASSAVTATNAADNLKATSTTSLLIATGSKVFATQAGKAFQNGGFVIASSQATPTNLMFGNVTSYVGTSLTVNVIAIGGAGTLADWNIAISGLQGPIGLTGPGGGGSGDVVGPASAVANRIATFNGTTGKLIADGGIVITNAVIATSTVTPAADRLLLFTGAATATVQTVTTDTKALLAAANYAAVLAQLGLTFPGNTRVLFDNAGVLGGDTGLTYAVGSQTLAVSGRLVQAGSTAAITTPAADNIAHKPLKYSRSWPAFKTEDLFQPLLQPLIGSLWRKYSAQIFGSTAGTPSTASIGGGNTPVGTLTSPALSNASFKARNPRIVATSVAAAGNVVSIASSGFWVTRSGSAGVGGFRGEWVFGLNLDQTGFRFFCGFQKPPFPSLSNPSTFTDIFALAYDDSDAAGGNFFIMQNDGSGTATRTSAGQTRNTTDMFRLILDCPPGGALMYWHLTNLTTGTITSGTVNSNMPTSDTELAPIITMTNAAVASSCAIDFMSASADAPIA